MVYNHTLSFGEASKFKQKRRHLTIAKKLEVLKMIKEGITCNAIACHFGVHKRTIFRIKKAGERIRKTAKITVNRLEIKFICFDNVDEVLPE